MNRWRRSIVAGFVRIVRTTRETRPLSLDPLPSSLCSDVAGHIVFFMSQTIIEEIGGRRVLGETTVRGILVPPLRPSLLDARM